MSRVFIFILLLTSCNTNTKITLKGIEFGTTYSVQYFDNEQLDYTNQLDSFDLIITLCGDARDKCPYFKSTTKHIHWDIEDPANFKGNEQELKLFK